MARRRKDFGGPAGSAAERPCLIRRHQRHHGTTQGARRPAPRFDPTPVAKKRLEWPARESLTVLSHLSKEAPRQAIEIAGKGGRIRRRRGRTEKPVEVGVTGLLQLWQRMGGDVTTITPDKGEPYSDAIDNLRAASLYVAGETITAEEAKDAIVKQVI